MGLMANAAPRPAAFILVDPPPDPGVDLDESGSADNGIIQIDQLDTIGNIIGEPPRTEESDRVGIGMTAGNTIVCNFSRDIDMLAADIGPPSNDNLDDTDNGWITAAA